VGNGPRERFWLWTHSGAQQTFKWLCHISRWASKISVLGEVGAILFGLGYFTHLLCTSVSPLLSQWSGCYED
jgi:hypothetical protein